MKSKLLKLLVMALKTSLYGVVLLTVFFSGINAREINAQRIESVQNVALDVKLIDANLSEAFRAIESQTTFKFAYERDDINNEVKINFNKKKATVADLLMEISKTANLKFRQVNDLINVNIRDEEKTEEVIEVIIQGITITGRVVSMEDDDGLPGVNVMVKGTSNGTVTDVEGNYSLNVPDEYAVLVFSSVGYIQEEIMVGQKSVINLSLYPDVTQLDEIVVVGYGTMRKSDLTGAIVSVKGEELQKNISSTFDQALQGKAAGVQVMVNSGQPGAASTIRIRGTNSIMGNNEPLYVIDGVQLSGQNEEVLNNAGNVWNASAKVSPLSTINPSDIESIEVLKDASAAAIYGNRGANGVILITTKKGSKNDSKIDYSISTGIKRIAKKVDVMGIQDYANLNNEQAILNGVSPRPEFADPNSLTGGTDWQEELFESGLITTHNLSFSGGKEKLTYFISGNYTDDSGPVMNTWMKRYSMRANLELEAKKWLKFGVNFTAGQSNTKYVFDNVTTGALGMSLKKAPDIRPYDEEGNYIGVEEGQELGGVLHQANPMAITEYQDSQKKKFNIYNNIFGEISFLDNFIFRTELNLTGDFTRDYAFDAKVSYAGYENSNSLLNERQHYTVGYEWKNILYFNKTIGKHSINAMAGHEAREGDWEYVGGSGGNFYNNNLNSLDQATNDSKSSNGSRGRWRQESYLARAFYNFNDLAMLTASFRADGSPNFPNGNRWGYFPSFSTAIRISNFDFFKNNIKIVNNLKLNGGWGQVGNDDVLGGQYRPLVAIAPSGENELSTTILDYNPDLKWEATESLNLGLEIGLFEDRINLQLEVYDKKTTDALYRIQPPLSIGSGLYAVGNIASVQNRGYEITLNTVNLAGDFKWRTDFNFTSNRNKILSLGLGIPEIRLVSRTEEGGPIGRFYGFQANGLYQDFEDIAGSARWNGYNSIDPTAGMWIGDYKFANLSDENRADWSVPGYTGEYDADGNYVKGTAIYTGNPADKLLIKDANIIDEEDQTYIGDPNPDFTFGFNNTFNFKNFDLSINCVGSYGNDIYNEQKVTLLATQQRNQNVLTIAKDRAIDELVSGGDPNNIFDYTLTNPSAEVPRIRLGNNFSHTAVSSRFVEDGSYLRIQNIVFGYTLPSSVVEKMKLSNLRVYFNGQNLFTFTNYSGWDPEIGSIGQNSLISGYDRGRYPVSKIFLLGLQVGF